MGFQVLSSLLNNTKNIKKIDASLRVKTGYSFQHFWYLRIQVIEIVSE